MIKNPILPGFNPDPSILRVGDDYYIATSTFEWFPGVQIHHSKDLKNWRLLTHPLDNTNLLSMKGNPISGGVWAPCLTYDDGTFYLVYTDTKSLYGNFKDTPNYYTTAKSIEGPWSDPVYLNSSGFDPSIFHDDDGRKYVLNMVWDHRKGRNMFWGIIMQELDVSTGKLIGEVKCISRGTHLGCTEGPHIYKKDGYYYLMTAEGGTGFEHAVTIERSKDLWGPYEVMPNNPLVSSSGKPWLELHKAGHGSFVETQNGEWYLVHLTGRPIGQHRRCVLGRETAIQKIEWTEEGWPQLEGGVNEPKVEVPAPNLPEHPWPEKIVRDDFDGDKIELNLASLRNPWDDWTSLSERKGYLRMYGQESIGSKLNVSLLAHRFESMNFEAACKLDFDPTNFQHLAGLMCLYDNENYYYLHITYDEAVESKVLMLCSMINGEYEEFVYQPLKLKTNTEYVLRVEFDEESLYFSYAEDGQDFEKIGPRLDATFLSDEHCREGWFTGAFVGISTHDVTGGRQHADFDWFEYRDL